MQTRDLLWKHRAQILAAAAACGAAHVRVFGSVARGDDKGQSDIDLLVSLAPGRTLLDLARLQVRLEQLLGRTVDIVTEDGLEEPVRSTVLQESINV